MGPRTRHGGAALVAALLLTFMSAVAPAGARPQAPSAASNSPPVVAPFFIVPYSKGNRLRTLIRLNVIAVPRGERVLSACSVCGKMKFVKTRGVTRVILRASSPLRMRSTTRVVIGITKPNSTGRWIVLGFRGDTYRGLGHGCMPASVKKLTRGEAARRSTIPHASCGPPSSPRSEYVYWNGTDHQLDEEQYNYPNWGTALPIGSGNAVGSAPTAVVHSDGERDVFWKGTNGHLYEMTYTGFWSNWQELQTLGKLDSTPSAVVDKQDVVHVFWKARDGFLRQMSDTGGVWSRPVPLNSGIVGSAPAIVVRPDGSLDLFWEGSTDRMLWEKHPGHLPKKVTGAGMLASAPTALVDANGIEHVFWRGRNAWLWEISDPDRHGSVSHQRSPSGALGSAPCAVVHPDHVQDVFWKGTDGRLWEMVWFSGRWHGSKAVSGTTHEPDSQPAAVLGR